jgi:hypothetical protein
MKIFNKKFKVRVNYFAEGRYQVQYAYYRLIPIWHTLCFWFEQTLTGGTECWTDRLMSIDEAEITAKRLKSIDDVREWYKPYEERMKIFYERKAEYYKKAVPYRTKQF